MLIADVYPLQTVYFLHFREQILLYRVDALDAQDIVRIDGTFSDFLAGFDFIAGMYL